MVNEGKWKRPRGKNIYDEEVMERYRRVMSESVENMMAQVERRGVKHSGVLIEALVNLIKRESNLTIKRVRGIDCAQQRRKKGGGEEEMLLKEINEMWKRTRGGKDQNDGEEAKFRRNAMKTLRMRDAENWRNFLEKLDLGKVSVREMFMVAKGMIVNKNRIVHNVPLQGREGEDVSDVEKKGMMFLRAYADIGRKDRTEEEKQRLKQKKRDT